MSGLDLNILTRVLLDGSGLGRPKFDTTRSWHDTNTTRWPIFPALWTTNYWSLGEYSSKSQHLLLIEGTSPGFALRWIELAKFDTTRLPDTNTIPINGYGSSNLTRLLNGSGPGQHDFFPCRVRVKIPDPFIQSMTRLYFLF